MSAVCRLPILASTAMFITGAAFGQPWSPPFDGPRYLLSLVGDVTGDGRVTAEDLQIVVAHAGQTTNVTILDGDANGDGRVDVADAALVTPRVGLSMVDLDLKTVEGRTAMVALVNAGHVLLDDPTAARQWNAVFKRTDRWPSYAGGATATEAHDPTVSESWEQGEHQTDSSGGDGWPDGHFYTFSITWPPNHHQSVSSYWPPNHNSGPSAGWEHDRTVSTNWPPMHYAHRSQEWINHGHGVEYSKYWPPNHTMSFSIEGWPPGHLRPLSRTVPPPGGEHVEAISLGWPPTPPPIWPPNHLSGVSATWPSEHATTTSNSWPPNHLKAASDTWNPGQPTWPGSHTMAQSIANPP